jgi:Na+-transporting methylmalonyl-CoA/oxaloacetate decarboxylase gamma subunit
MDQFEKKRFLLPIELMIALGINVVVAVLSYYAIVMWGLFRD